MYKPQGKPYENQSKVVFEDEHLKDFIEMCFNLKSSLFFIKTDTKSTKICYNINDNIRRYFI